jgi:hypothetical protein
MDRKIIGDLESMWIEVVMRHEYAPGKIMKTVKAGVLTQIRTGHLLNTSRKCYYLSTGWSWVVSPTHWTLRRLRHTPLPQYPLNSRPGGSQKQSAHFGEAKNLFHSGYRLLTILTELTQLPCWCNIRANTHSHTNATLLLAQSPLDGKRTRCAPCMGTHYWSTGNSYWLMQLLYREINICVSYKIVAELARIQAGQSGIWILFGVRDLSCLTKTNKMHFSYLFQ